MNREEAIKFLLEIADNLGTTGIEYYTDEDGDKMRKAILIITDGESSDYVVTSAE